MLYNSCKYCKKLIIPKSSKREHKQQAKIKQFCNSSCAASYNNSKRKNKGNGRHFRRQRYKNNKSY